MTDRDAERIAAIDHAAARIGEFADLMALQVRIWSGEHRAYWRPKGQGYTSRRREAGIWPLADAYRETSHCGPEKLIAYEPILSTEKV